MIDQLQIDNWKRMARRDDWHMLLVGSDIRVMLGEIERLQANQERMWCKACGTVTRDRQCDCTKFSDQDTQSLVNYADAMQKSAHEEEQENEKLRAALGAVLAHEKQSAEFHGLTDCNCMNHSREAEQKYEMGHCPHQLARAALNHEQNVKETK